MLVLNIAVAIPNMLQKKLTLMLPLSLAVRDSHEKEQHSGATRPEYSLAQSAKALIVRLKQKAKDGALAKRFCLVIKNQILS